jgi:hypothetical protein
MAQAVQCNIIADDHAASNSAVRIGGDARRVSRRGIVSGLLGVGALAAAAVPSLAADAGAPFGDHPDRKLFGLAREYEAALKIEQAADARMIAISEAYEAAAPMMPDVLRHRILDHTDFSFPMRSGGCKISDDDGDFYTYAEVEKLRARPQKRLTGYVIDLTTGVKTPATAVTPYKEVLQERHLWGEPWPEAQARADEIVAAWDRHTAAHDALEASLGYDAAEEAYYDAVRAREAIGATIAAERATTLAGLRIRAAIVAARYEDDDLEPEEGHTIVEKMMWAVMRDLMEMTNEEV